MNLEVMSIILILEIVMVIFSWTITLIFIFNEVLRRRLIKKIKAMGLESSISMGTQIPPKRQTSVGGYEERQKKVKEKPPKPSKVEKQSYEKQNNSKQQKGSPKPKPKVEEKVPESKSDLLESMSKWGEF